MDGKGNESKEEEVEGGPFQKWTGPWVSDRVRVISGGELGNRLSNSEERGAPVSDSSSTCFVWRGCDEREGDEDEDNEDNEDENIEEEEEEEDKRRVKEWGDLDRDDCLDTEEDKEEEEEGEEEEEETEAITSAS